jgi:acetylornithine/N-succinyldiaminopimelate aminotransferase
LAGKKIDWKAIENKYYMKTFKRFPVTLIDGRGAHVWDDNGKEYLDFFGGLAVNSLGHCHPVIVKALNHQAKSIIQTTCLYYTIPQLRLAQLLVDNSCFDRIFFSNSGTEACEGAVKLARRYGKLHLNGAYKVITANNSFHGRTLAMVAAT